MVTHGTIAQYILKIQQIILNTYYRVKVTFLGIYYNSELDLRLPLFRSIQNEILLMIKTILGINKSNANLMSLEMVSLCPLSSRYKWDN